MKYGEELLSLGVGLVFFLLFIWAGRRGSSWNDGSGPIVTTGTKPLWADEHEFDFPDGTIFVSYSGTELMEAYRNGGQKAVDQLLSNLQREPVRRQRWNARTREFELMEKEKENG
jgi:hypothetical protein